MQFKGQAGHAVFKRSSLLPNSEVNQSWLLQIPLALIAGFGRKIFLTGSQDFLDKKEFDRLCHIWQREINQENGKNIFKK